MRVDPNGEADRRREVRAVVDDVPSPHGHGPALPGLQLLPSGDAPSHGEPPAAPLALGDGARPLAAGGAARADRGGNGGRRGQRTRVPAGVVGRPTIQGDKQKINVSNAADVADWLRLELGKGELSGLFRRGGDIVYTPRIDEAGYLPPEETGDEGAPGLEVVTAGQVKALVEVRYDVGKGKVPQTTEHGKTTRVAEWQPALFPRGAADSAVEAAHLGQGAPHLRVLRGVTATPLLRLDGTVLDTPGYDPATGLLYLPEPGLVVPAVPNEPTDEQVRKALDLILTPIRQFPFVRPHDAANWVGLAFTPVLRLLLPPPYPLFVVTAPTPGSGKTLLTGVLKDLHGAVFRAELPGDSEELRRTITAILDDTTAPVVIFDNLTGVVRSSVLAALLTSASWSDRRLGTNRTVEASNDRVWVATGNNAQIGGDLARRTVFIEIDPGVPDPHRRTGFALRPGEWMHEHRGRYLAALLTAARAWHRAGAPTELTRSDDYAEWAGSLRGMMHCAGLTWNGEPAEFGAERNPAVLVSFDDDDWATFLAALYGAFGDAPFTVRAIAEALRRRSPSPQGPVIDAALLPGDLPEKWARVGASPDAEGGFRKSLGQALKHRTGRYAARWKLVEADRDPHDKVARYAVQPPLSAHP